MTEPATLTIPEAAQLLGVGRNLAYEAVADTGELAGVQVIRVGRRLVIPRAPFLEALGVPHNGSDPAEAGPSSGTTRRAVSRANSTPPTEEGAE